MDIPLEHRTVVVDGECVLYQRANSSRWWVMIRVESGKWERFSTKTNDFAEAKKIYGEVLYKSANNQPLVTRSFSSIAKAVIKQLEDTRGTLVVREIRTR